MNFDNWGLRIDGEEGVSSGGALAMLPYHDIKDAAGVFVGVRVYDVRHLFSDAFGDTNGVEKIGFAIHHDAAVMADEDKNFNGTTLDEELDRINVIHRYHTVTNGWPGIGYHRLVAPSGRIFITGGSASQRAHVAQLNHKWIGWCLMGDWSAGRPGEKQTNALKAGLQWETNLRGSVRCPSMLMAPHKRLTPGTECPGGWAAKDAWEGLTLLPQAAAPPPPPPPVAAAPTPTVDLERARALARDLLTTLGG